MILKTVSGAYTYSCWYDNVSHSCVCMYHSLSLSICSDGLGRTGTFIAIWSLIEQMKAEGQIDVVGTIKSIRTQRPGAVPHLVRA